MKVIQINNIYPSGSTGKIVLDLHTEYKKSGIESLIIYSAGPKINERGYYKVTTLFYTKIQALITRFTGLLYGGCLISTRKIINIIKKEKPDIVHLHCINGHMVNIPKLVSWLKKNNIKTVLTNHAELMYTANCGHAFECSKYQTGCGKCDRFRQDTKSWFFDQTRKSWNQMYRAFDGFVNNLTVVNVSQWLENRSANSTILKNCNNICIVNGINTDIFNYSKTQSHSNKIVFHATACFSDDEKDLKGGRYVIELARKMPDVSFVVASGKCELKSEVPSNLVLLGRISDQNKLAEYYSNADLTIITSKREAFSMVTSESLCCGTPVVGFQSGGPETIAIDAYSRFVEQGNVDALCEAIKEFLNKDFDRRAISDEARLKYSKQTMANQYIEVYQKLING